MLARLRHDGFIRGNHEHDEVDSANTGKHILHETLVPRNVNKPYGRVRIEREMGKAEIDRNATLFLFLQSIGVDAGERLDQSSFAVINVSGSAYDNARHNNC